MKFTPAEPDSGTILVRPGQRDAQQTVFYFQLWSALLGCKIALLPISFYPSFILPPLQDHCNCSEGPSSPWQSPSILDCRLPCRERRREGAGERVVTYDTYLKTCSHRCCQVGWDMMCNSQGSAVSLPAALCDFSSGVTTCWQRPLHICPSVLLGDSCLFFNEHYQSTGGLKLASHLAESSQQFQMKKTKQTSEVL